MDKDRLVEVANAIFNGANASDYRNELDTIIAILLDTSDEAIAEAWAGVKNDADA